MDAPSPHDDPGGRTETLVQRAHGGDRSALAALLDRYETRVRRVVRRRLGSGLRGTLDSGDVVQEVMVEVLRSIDGFTPRGERAFLRWMTAVVENKLRNLARRERRGRTERASTALLASLTGGASDPRPEEIELVERALGRLSEDHRRVLRARHWEQLSFDEIGAAMGRSGNAVWMLHKRAMAELTLAVRSLRHKERDAS